MAASVLLLAVALRGHGLSQWSLSDDEIYTYYDVQRILDGGQWPHGARSHPLVYLGIAGVASVGGVEREWVLRALPALCGVLAVAALLWLRRDAVPRGVALMAGLLAAWSPWLVHAAQDARFYGPLLMFATLATLFALPGAGRRPLTAGLCAVLAALCHPSALLLAPALALPLLLPPVDLRRAGVLLVLALAAGAALWATDDGALAMVVARALGELDPSHYDLPHFVLGLGYALGPLVGILAGLGLLHLWRKGHGAPTPAAVQFTACALLPPLVLLGLGVCGVSVHQRYAMAAVPAALLLAGHGVLGLAERSRPWAGVALLLALASQAPALLAQLADGNRHDVRSLAAVLAERASPDDIIVVDDHATLELYLQREPGFADVKTVEDSFVDARKRRDFLGNKNQVWVALKASRLAQTYDPELMDWVREHFSEATWVGRAPGTWVRHDNRYVLFRRSRRVLGGRRRRHSA